MYAGGTIGEDSIGDFAGISSMSSSPFSRVPASFLNLNRWEWMFKNLATPISDL